MEVTVDKCCCTCGPRECGLFVRAACSIFGFGRIPDARKSVKQPPRLTAGWRYESWRPLLVLLPEVM